MLYQFVKPLARWILGINFRRIHIAGIERLPAKGPIILACNHPTAFIEPCVMASFQNRPLHFLVRGDFFRNKLFGFLLKVLHMIPIYRMKDGGYSKIKNNFDSFVRCYEALGEGKALMILAEGFCIHEKRLRPIRKGTARIAFGAYDHSGKEDLQIFPVGVNYTNSDAYRSDLMISIGEPILMKDYTGTFQGEALENNPVRPEGVRQLTEAISNGLAQHVVHIDSDEDVALLEYIWELWRNDHLAPQAEAYDHNGERLFTEKSFSDQINQMESSAKEVLKKEIKGYFSELDNNGLKDIAFSAQNNRNKNWPLLILGFPIFLIGALIHILPLFLIHQFGGLKGIDIEFRHAIKLAAGIGVFIIWYLVLAFWAAQINLWFFPIICILVPILGWAAIRYREYFNYARQLFSAKHISAQLTQTIKQKREQILETLIEKGLWE